MTHLYLDKKGPRFEGSSCTEKCVAKGNVKIISSEEHMEVATFKQPIYELSLFSLLMGPVKTTPPTYPPSVRNKDT